MKIKFTSKSPAFSPAFLRASLFISLFISLFSAVCLMCLFIFPKNSMANGVSSNIPNNIPNNNSSVLSALNAIEQSLERINSNISVSQDVMGELKEQMQVDSEKSQQQSSDMWENYLNIQSESLYPKQPMPAWQGFVDMDNADFLTQGDSVKSFVFGATNNKLMLSQLNQALSAGVDRGVEFPLRLGLAKSVSMSSQLQVERLNTVLSLQAYRLQVEQIQALNRLTNLVSLALINNDLAQKKQQQQLQAIYKQLDAGVKR